MAIDKFAGRCHALHEQEYNIKGACHWTCRLQQSKMCLVRNNVLLEMLGGELLSRGSDLMTK